MDSYSTLVDRRTSGMLYTSYTYMQFSYDLWIMKYIRKRSSSVVVFVHLLLLLFEWRMIMMIGFCHFGNSNRQKNIREQHVMGKCVVFGISSYWSFKYFYISITIFISICEHLWLLNPNWVNWLFIRITTNGIRRVQRFQ